MSVVCLLQLYGSLVGMFEYNNLALTVPGPVGRYKAMLGEPQAHGIAPDEAAAALQEVRPLLEALGDTADEPAEVSGLHTTGADNRADCIRWRPRRTAQSCFACHSSCSMSSALVLKCCECNGS